MIDLFLRSSQPRLETSRVLAQIMHQPSEEGRAPDASEASKRARQMGGVFKMIDQPMPCRSVIHARGMRVIYGACFHHPNNSP
jgi:hypothetical protein